MSHISEVVFDLAPIDAPEDAYQMDYVRLAYESLEELPQRIFQQIRSEDKGTTGIVRPVVTEMVGTVALAEPVDAKRMDEVRFDIELGDAPELIANLRMTDLIPVESPEHMEHPRLGKRRQYRVEHEEALARRAEGWTEADEHMVEMERIQDDPTGTGEGGVPPMSPGAGADEITKIYLVDRKEPIQVYGSLEKVRDAIWHEIGGAPASSRWVQFQRVNRDAVVMKDDVVINPAFVVSLQSNRLAEQ